ncbi:MAG: cation transporter [Saprospirales bacterium]|nr:MAG: cation transporter [Saprospirales bacterium]
MKSLIIFLTITLTALSLHAQSDAFTVRVDGMGCAFCAHGVEAKFSEVKGIENIEIDLKKGILTYTVPAELNMDFAMVKNLVDGAGYTVIYVEVKRADGSEDRFENREDYPEEEIGIIEAVIQVYGNCSMCKERIEKAALALKGVQEANWDENDQLLKVIYDASDTKLKEIHEAVAAVGHDTELVRARNRTYQQLHHCCKYDRPSRR